MFSRDLEQMFQPIRKRCRLPLKLFSVCKSTKNTCFKVSSRYLFM